MKLAAVNHEVSDMADDNKKIPGSTATPSEFMSPVVTTRKVNTDEFQMGGVTVNGISVDHTETNPKKLATSFALQQAENELNKSIEGLKSTVDEYTFQPVLSEALASPHFVDLSRWQRNGWMIDNGTAFYANNKAPAIGQATLRLTVDAFMHPGNHYLDMQVNQVPAGSTLTVIDYHDNVLLSITAPGQYKTIFNVDYPGVFYLDFRADNMEPGTSMVIDSISVHRIKPEFESFQDFMAMLQTSGGKGFATLDQVTLQLENVDTALRNYINVAISTLRDQMVDHINDRVTNPHGITCEMIHAAKDNHTHDFRNFEGMTDSIMLPLNTAIAQLAVVADTLKKHLEAENPHEIDPYKIGAAPAVHSHVISDIDQLQNVIDSLETRLSNDSDERYQDMITQLSSVMSTLDEFVQHFSEWESYVNESLECAPESLGIIFATDAEAQEGVRDDRYMSPQLTRSAVTAWSQWKDVDVTKRYGRAFGHFVLTQSNASVKIELNPAALYQIVLTGDSNWGVTGLTITPNGAYSNNSAIVAAIRSGDGAVTNEALSGNTLKICPATSSFVRLFGTWQFLPGTMMLYGNGIGYQGTATAISGSPQSVVTYAAHVTPGVQTGCTEATIALTTPDTNSKVELFIYELVGVQEQHGIAADANPAGTIVERFGNAPMRDYSLFDGSVLRRDLYEDLYKAAVASGKMISRDEWQAMVDAIGVCESFHTGDGATTFGLPKLDTTGPINKYIKLKNTFLANPGQIFFEYVWS